MKSQFQYKTNRDDKKVHNEEDLFKKITTKSCHFNKTFNQKYPDNFYKGRKLIMSIVTSDKEMMAWTYARIVTVQ